MYKVGLFFRKHKESFYLIGCLVLYGVLAFLFKIPCPIKKLTGISCPGCGMSRALISLFTLDFSMAMYYHPLVIFVVPVTIALVVFYERNMVKSRRVLIAIAASALVIVYLYRMIFIQSDVLEFHPENNYVTQFWVWFISLFS